MIGNRTDEHELELFKTRISLAEYAAFCGYTLDKKSSSKHSYVMRHANGDKIVIARDKDGHDVYFSVRDQSDNGSIIDFIQRRRGLSLGQVRKELRRWLGLGLPLPPGPGPSVESVEKREEKRERIGRPEPIERNRANLIVSFHRLKEYDGDYLERERMLDHSTIEAFAPVIKQDSRGNVCFIHRDQNGDVTGWELKNRLFTGFSAGGSKSLCMHMPSGERVQRVVVVESMIDAMSYYQLLRGIPGDLYVSIAGTVSESQAKQLQSVIKSAPVVVAATDNDEMGHKYADMMRQWRPDIIRELPDRGKDWNDDLKHYARQHEIEIDFGL